MTTYNVKFISIQIQRHPDMDSPEKNVYDESEVCIRLSDIVRSLSIDPTGVKFAVGSSGTTDSPPLHVIDIERYDIDIINSCEIYGWIQL